MTLVSRDGDFTMLVAEERLETLRLDRLYREWREAGGNGQPPGIGFLDPQAHDYIASMLVIIDVVKDGEHRRYRYRSAGSHFIQHTKVDPAGTYMDQHPEPAFAEMAARACDLVVETRRPIHARIQRSVDGQPFLVEFLLLPVVNSVGSVVSLLVAQIYTPA
jgi:hypothetical protein